jgi:hypothetical protein
MKETFTKEEINLLKGLKKLLDRLDKQHKVKYKAILLGVIDKNNFISQRVWTRDKLNKVTKNGR